MARTKKKAKEKKARGLSPKAASTPSRSGASGRKKGTKMAPSAASPADGDGDDVPSSSSSSSPSRRSEQWTARLSELREYQRSHPCGSGAVPPAGGRYGDLRRWCDRQREQLRRVRDGRPTSLTGEQVHELMEVGLADDDDDGGDGGNDDDGAGGSARASSAGLAAGTVRGKGTPTKKERGGGGSVCLSGTQLDALRVVFDGTDGELRRTLEAAGATFAGLGDKVRERKWWARLEDLRRYRQRTGHAYPSAREDRALYHWAERQREQLRLAAAEAGAGGGTSSDGAPTPTAAARGASGRTRGGVAGRGRSRPASSPLSSPARGGIPIHRLIPPSVIVAAARRSVVSSPPSAKRKRSKGPEDAAAAAAASAAGKGDERPAEAAAPPSTSSSVVAGGGPDGAVDASASSIARTLASCGSPGAAAAAAAARPSSSSRREKKWYAKLAELREWKAKHGTVDVPCREQSLYAWQLRMQRLLALHCAGRPTPLKPEWARELEAVGLGSATYASVWVGRGGDAGAAAVAAGGESSDGDDGSGGATAVDDNNRDWDAFFRDLQRYKEKNGSCDVPHPYGPDRALGRWTERQRAEYGACREGREPPGLTSRQIGMLDGLGFPADNSIDPIPKVDQIWLRDFEALEAYHDKCGTVHAKAKGDKQVHAFVQVQRRQMSCLKNGLPSELKDGWIKMLLGLDKDFFPQEKKTNHISAEQVADLEAVLLSSDQSTSKRRKVGDGAGGGGSAPSEEKSVESMRKRIWREKLDELRRYKEENGHCKVTIGDDRELFFWLLGQKEQLQLTGGKTGLLQLMSSPKQEEGMQTRKNGAHGEAQTEGGAYMPVRETKWFLKLNELQKYKAKNGHCDVKVEQNRKLYHWVMRQREKMQLEEEGGLSGLKDTWVAELKKLGLSPRSAPIKSSKSTKEGAHSRSNGTSAVVDESSKREQN